MRFLFLILTLPTISFAQNEQTLFQLLSPSQTNITFENTITDEKDHNILLYSNYYGGAGVGVGDFNNDGLPDLFFAGNLVGDKLYLNDGKLKFKDITKSAGINNNGGWSSGVLVADVNNDGWQDIYVTRELYDDKPNLRRNVLYINNGTSTPQRGINEVYFTERAAEYGIDDSERTRHATFIDYNKDGFLDLFLLNQPPNPGNYSPFFGVKLLTEEWAPRLYKNNGNGTFSEVTKAAGVLKAGYGNSVVAADVNKDGWQDLYIANDYESPDFLYLNNGDGTFKNVIHDATRHISYYAMGVDAADINNDGWLDLMTLDMVAEDNFRLKSNMGGMYPEAFWKIVNEGGHHQYMFNALHLNNGNWKNSDGSFSDIAQIAGVSSTDWSWANLIADFDNDGWKDIFVTNGLLRDIRNTDSSKEFPKYVQKKIDEFIKNNPNAGDVSIFDILNLEEALNLIPSVPLKNYAFKNNGDLTFSKKTDDWGFDKKTFSNGTSYADLDNDGDLDLIVNNINEVASIYENHAEKSDNNWLRIQLTDSKTHQTLLGSKIEIEANGKRQFIEFANVRGMYSTSENVAHFGVGDANFVRILVTFPNGKEASFASVQTNQVFEIDLNGPHIGLPKTALPTPTFKTVTETSGLKFEHVENDFDDYEKQVLLPHKMSQFGPALAVGDVNGDGFEDVFAGGAKGFSAQLFIQSSQGDFVNVPRPVFQTDKDFEDVDATFFDVDNDGDLDLYVVSGGNTFPPQNKMYQDRLYINEGGKFQKSESILPRFRESGSCIKPHDFDGDGDLDLFIGGRHNPWDYPAPTVSRLLRNDGGNFTDITKKNAKDLIFLGMVTDAVWTDFDSDGDSDLMIVGEWMPITFFENNNGKFEKIGDEQLAIGSQVGWWYSIEKSDIDEDGDDDYFVGNLGLNYKYKASDLEPFEVHYDDFDQSGKKDIVLSYYNFGERYPLRGRSCSSEQVPVLKEKFPSYNIFASADLETVYGGDNLANALHYSANTFANVFIENRGKGDFKITRLPNEAQVSSINDFLIDDFDQDGKKDILLAGNLYPAEIETTRNDASIGLLLKGDGNGNWQPLKAKQSGVSLPFDIKKIRKVKTANGDLYLFGVNDGRLQVLTKNE
jgi:hypothetical protein